MGTQLTRYDFPRPIDGVDEHIHFANSTSGGYKSVCTSYCLGALGIPPASYNYSAHRNQRDNVLRRNGYAVRSRVSKAKQAAKRTASQYALGTVDGLRETIQAGRKEWLDHWVNAVYLVTVMCPPVEGEHEGGRHLILLSQSGHTHTDTAPVEGDVDDREVLHVQAVFPNGLAHRASKTNSERTRKGLVVGEDGVARKRGGLVGVMGANVNFF